MIDDSRLPDADLTRLVVCGRCGRVRGDFRSGRHPGATDHHQRCECEPRPDPPAPRPGGLDFPAILELCYACGLEPLASGSRWSVWFCRPCLAEVRAANQAAGRVLVPIGRHSLMNRVGVRVPPASAEVRSLAGFLRALARGSDRLVAAAGAEVRRRMGELGLGGRAEVPLAEYLAAVERRRPPRDGAVARLLAAVADPGEGPPGRHA